MTVEVFELSHNQFYFGIGCVHINYVQFSMLITWISGRGDPVEINHWSSYAETFLVVAMGVVSSNPWWGQVSGRVLNKSCIDCLVNLLKPF